MGLAAGQEDGKKTAFSICDCVDFCVAPAARASNRLALFPLFPPDAERCALMCVESIICVFRSSAGCQLSEQLLPHAALGPAQEAIVNRGRRPVFWWTIAPPAPALETWTMPLMTRRSSTRSLPRTSVGKCGLICPHCASLSQNRLSCISASSKHAGKENQQRFSQQQFYRILGLVGLFFAKSRATVMNARSFGASEARLGK